MDQRVFKGFLRVVVCFLPLLVYSCGPPTSRHNGGEIPEFPWPPLKPSAFADVPVRLTGEVAAPTRLRDVADILVNALNKAGYAELSFYHVPNGFALATRLEQINADGTPREENYRWSTKVPPPKVFNISSYLKALFTANPGRFRVIVFVVTTPFGFTDSTATRDQAMQWVNSGFTKLPTEIGDSPFTKQHSCTALIYEFDQPTSNQEPLFEDPSELSGKVHLEQAGLWRNIANE
ncbi:MAG: hypothetical protein WB699_02360 [Bacteroidota bacterium]